MGTWFFVDSSLAEWTLFSCIYAGKIYFDISEALMCKRVLSRKQDRFDDNETTLTERIAVYRQTIKLILQDLQKKNKLFRIDASLDSEQIASQVDQIIVGNRSSLRVSRL